MSIFVREYDWMWHDLGLSLAECRVFAYIHGLTNKKSETGGRGYSGSKRQLAKLLGLDAGATKRIMDTLEEKHLIACTDDLWQSVVYSNACVASDNENVASDNIPQTPLYNKDKMKRNEKIARDTIATQDPQTENSFERLWKAYTLRVKGYKMADSLEKDCRMLWDAYPFWKKKLLLEQLFKPDGWWKPRLDWTLSDFDPQPTNMQGKPLDPEVRYRIARWNGAWGMYSEKDIADFSLEVTGGHR